jgi:DNA-binding NtrC family response regulator
MVADAKMRDDLYFRLAIITIEIPPLRDRHEDLIALANRFITRFAEKHRKAIRGFSREALDAILRHQWPGNVRELGNTLERAVLLSRGELITPDDLRLLPALSATHSEKLEDVEREHILGVLRATGWQMNRAADRLGIHRNTLRNKLKEYGIDEGE